MRSHRLAVDDAPQQTETWREIDASLLAEAHGAVPPFPLPSLPPGWERWVANTAQAAGTPVDYVALGLLAAVAALGGAGVQAQVMPSWSEPAWPRVSSTPGRTRRTSRRCWSAGSPTTAQHSPCCRGSRASPGPLIAR